MYWMERRGEGFFPGGWPSGHAAALLLPCCSIISSSLHLLLRQQGGLRRAMTGKKQKAIWPEEGGSNEGEEGEAEVLDSSLHFSAFFLFNVSLRGYKYNNLWIFD